MHIFRRRSDRSWVMHLSGIMDRPADGTSRMSTRERCLSEERADDKCQMSARG